MSPAQQATNKTKANRCKGSQKLQVKSNSKSPVPNFSRKNK